MKTKLISFIAASACVILCSCSEDDGPKVNLPQPQITCTPGEHSILVSWSEKPSSGIEYAEITVSSENYKKTGKLYANKESVVHRGLELVEHTITAVSYDTAGNMSEPLVLTCTPDAPFVDPDLGLDEYTPDKYSYFSPHSKDGKYEEWVYYVVEGGLNKLGDCWFGMTCDVSHDGGNTPYFPAEVGTCVWWADPGCGSASCGNKLVFRYKSPREITLRINWTFKDDYASGKYYTDITLPAAENWATLRHDCGKPRCQQVSYGEELLDWDKTRDGMRLDWIGLRDKETVEFRNMHFE